MIGDGALSGRLQRAVPGLRAAVRFGSTLSPATMKADSIPDVFALVDDLDAALAALGVPALVRPLARGLAPVTVALPDGRGGAVAKLNLATPAQAARTLARLRDLSLAGRLAKKTRLVYHRDAATCAELARLLEAAADAMVRASLLGLPRRLSLEAACRRCFALSYRAELRPERSAHIDERFDAFAQEYRARYGARLVAAAATRGFRFCDGGLIDERPSWRRFRETVALVVLLGQSRLRTLARLARQALVYQGWWPYLVGKLRRARA